MTDKSGLFIRTGKDASVKAVDMTKVDIDDGSSLLLPNAQPVPTPFALQVMGVHVGGNYS